MRNPARILTDKLSIESGIRDQESIDYLRGFKVMAKFCIGSYGVMTGIGVASNALILGDEQIVGQPDLVVDTINKAIDGMAVGGVVMGLAVGGSGMAEFYRLHQVASERIDQLQNISNENN